MIRSISTAGRSLSDSLRSRLSRPVTTVALVFSTIGVQGAAAADQVYFSAVDNITALLVQKINAETVRIDLSAGNKRQLMSQLAQIAAARLSIDPSDIVDAITERERLGSTGFGGGVAIPHGKLAGLDRVYALVVRLAAPIDYKAIDGAPVDLIFMLLSPPDAGADHLKALAAVSRLIRHGGIVEKLRGARSRDALAAVLLGAEERDAA